LTGAGPLLLRKQYDMRHLARSISVLVASHRSNGDKTLVLSVEGGNDSLHTR